MMGLLVGLLLAGTPVKVTAVRNPDPVVLPDPRMGRTGRSTIYRIDLPRPWRYGLKFTCSAEESASVAVDGPGIVEVEIESNLPRSPLCYLTEWTRLTVTPDTKSL